jgi:hypothetical protein
MKTLYHASPSKNLTVIQPQRTLSRDKYIGDYVFATSDLKLAAMYLATKGKGTLMDYTSKEPAIVICSDEREYVRNDKGGAIYIVPADSFKKSPQEGLEESEVVSKVPVTPLDKKVYEHSLDAMHELGITVYFADQKTFDALVKARDEKKLLKKLRPYTKI